MREIPIGSSTIQGFRFPRMAPEHMREGYLSAALLQIKGRKLCLPLAFLLAVGLLFSLEPDFLLHALTAVLGWKCVDGRFIAAHPMSSLRRLVLIKDS